MENKRLPTQLTAQAKRGMDAEETWHETFTGHMAQYLTG
jgi:hypothetical protein